MIALACNARFLTWSSSSLLSNEVWCAPLVWSASTTGPCTAVASDTPDGELAKTGCPRALNPQRTMEQSVRCDGSSHTLAAWGGRCALHAARSESLHLMPCWPSESLAHIVVTSTPRWSQPWNQDKKKRNYTNNHYESEPQRGERGRIGVICWASN